ncbi:MAG: hypothetical protein M1834_008686 [Cirrosporium novae-zelandiae]|nr:MAG: hypothetical protein M1834_008686 [Cirrosporium novae-zelandiae]
MSRSRITTLIGVGSLGGIGYYFWQAGGNAKLAEKNFENDTSKLSSRVKNELPGREQQAKKEGEEWAQQAGAKIDRTVDKARAKLREADAQADQYRKEGIDKFEQTKKETGTQINQAIDSFDKTVEKKTAEAKGGIWSWFGGK